jgi:hypothetical protein
VSSRSGIFIVLIAVLAMLGAAPAPAAGLQGARAADSALYVTFHANHTITMTLLDGTPVGTTSAPPSVIPAGDYTIHLDNSDEVAGPEFNLAGPGVKVVDDMFFGEAPSSTHGVTLQPNATYTWRDDEQPNVVFTFTTSAAAAGSSGGTSTGGTSSSSSSASGSSSSSSVVGSGIKPIPLRGTLIGTVGAAGRLTLEAKGRGVSTIKSGRYKISVDDTSARWGFTVREVRKPAVTVTGTSFVGKRTVTVDLKAGQWLFYPSSTGKKSYFVVSA